MALTRRRFLPLTRVARVVIVGRSCLRQALLFRSNTGFLGNRLRAAVARRRASRTIEYARDDACNDKRSRTRHSRATKNGSATVFHGLRMTYYRRLILTCVNRRSHLIPNRFNGLARRLARFSEAIYQVCLQFCGHLYLLNRQDLRAFRPLLITIGLGRLGCLNRHVLTVPRSHGVCQRILISFAKISFGVCLLNLLNMYIRLANSTIIRARACHCRRVTFLHLSAINRAPIRARRPRVRQVIKDRDKRARRNTSNQGVNAFCRAARFFLYATWLRALSRRGGEAFNFICRVNDLARNLKLCFQGKRVATSGVGLAELVVRRSRLNVLNGVGRGQAKAATLNCVGDTTRHPDGVLKAAGLVNPLTSKLHRARRVALLGDVEARRKGTRLSNCRRSEHAIRRNVNGANRDIRNTKATNRRTRTCPTQRPNVPLYYVNNSLFVAGRGIIRFISVSVRNVVGKRSNSAKVARSNLCPFILRQARRDLYAYGSFLNRVIIFIISWSVVQVPPLSTRLAVRTWTFGSLNAAQLHIVKHYKQTTDSSSLGFALVLQLKVSVSVVSPSAVLPVFPPTTTSNRA